MIEIQEIFWQNVDSLMTNYLDSVSGKSSCFPCIYAEFQNELTDLQGSKLGQIIAAPIQAAMYQSSIFYTTPDVPNCQIR